MLRKLIALCVIGAASVLPTMATASATQASGTLSISGTHFNNGDTATYSFTVNASGNYQWYIDSTCYAGGSYWRASFPTVVYPGGKGNQYGYDDYTLTSPSTISWAVDVPLTKANCYTDLFVKQGSNHIKLAEVTFGVN